jgi:hypothetical protein
MRAKPFMALTAISLTLATASVYLAVSPLNWILKADAPAPRTRETAAQSPAPLSEPASTQKPDDLLIRDRIARLLRGDQLAAVAPRATQTPSVVQTVTPSPAPKKIESVTWLTFMARFEEDTGAVFYFKDSKAGRSRKLYMDKGDGGDAVTELGDTTITLRIDGNLYKVRR